MFQFIAKVLHALAWLGSDTDSSWSASSRSEDSASSQDWNSSDDWMDERASSSWQPSTAPAFNIDGTPMCGDIDIHGNCYGVTSMVSDSWSSSSICSDSWSSDSFGSMGCSSDW